MAEAEPWVSWPSIWSAKRAWAWAATGPMGCEVMRRLGEGLGAPVEAPGVQAGGVDGDCLGDCAGATEAMVSSDGGTFILPMYLELSGVVGLDFVPVWTLFGAGAWLAVWVWV